MSAQADASATGITWLSCYSNEEAIEMIVRQGLGPPSGNTSGTPRTMKEVLTRIGQARERGYGIVVDKDGDTIRAYGITGLPSSTDLAIPF